MMCPRSTSWITVNDSFCVIKIPLATDDSSCVPNWLDTIGSNAGHTQLVDIDLNPSLVSIRILGIDNSEGFPFPSALTIRHNDAAWLSTNVAPVMSRQRDKAVLVNEKSKCFPIAYFVAVCTDDCATASFRAKELPVGSSKRDVVRVQTPDFKRLPFSRHGAIRNDDTSATVFGTHKSAHPGLKAYTRTGTDIWNNHDAQISLAG